MRKTISFVSVVCVFGLAAWIAPVAFAQSSGNFSYGNTGTTHCVLNNDGTGTITGGQISLSWPGWASNYSVYYATNLNAPVAWFLVTNQTQTVDGNIGVTLPVANDRVRFYRLKSN